MIRGLAVCVLLLGGAFFGVKSDCVLARPTETLVALEWEGRCAPLYPSVPCLERQTLAFHQMAVARVKSASGGNLFSQLKNSEKDFVPAREIVGLYSVSVLQRKEGLRGTLVEVLLGEDNDLENESARLKASLPRHSYPSEIAQADGEALPAEEAERQIKPLSADSERASEQTFETAYQAWQQRYQTRNRQDVVQLKQLQEELREIAQHPEIVPEQKQGLGVEWAQLEMEIEAAAPGRNWIEENLALFLTLIHLAWIIPTVLGIWIAKRVTRRRAEKRTGDLKIVAQELDLTFLGKEGAFLEQSLSQFSLFQLGRARQLSNLLVAEAGGVQISLFDYEYVTGHGKHKRVRRQTGAAVQAESLRLPPFSLRPQGKRDILGKLVGKQDIDFEDHPDFSRAFVLKSTAEENVREFFDQGLLDLFARDRTISLEAAGGVFIYYRRWKRVNPQTQEMKAFMSEAYRVHQAFSERLARG